MRTTAALFIGALGAGLSAHAIPAVDTTYPYTGPAIPIGDFVDQTVNGNGKGFPRLVEPPAVTPFSKKATNNINVISLAYVPNGMNIHFQTPFGIGHAPEVLYGTSIFDLFHKATGATRTYDRTPPCSLVAVTQCSQFFHDVQLTNLKPGVKYYYLIPGGNGTAPSEILSFETARQAGQKGEFSVALINDMGYTNAGGTHKQLLKAVSEGTAFAWHGGDLSYADDWYSGILPCESDWPVCYNGSHSSLPGGVDNLEYDTPLPKGEVANQGGPLGGDMSTIYESNWDLWQQWMYPIWGKIPYMTNPGNHEASCAEFDGPNNELTALLVNNQLNSTAPKSNLTYYSCPPSQRNFTAYSNRFRMPGKETGGQSNFWYSFDYGLAHFLSFDGETDYYKSPEWPFVADLTGSETHPTEKQTFPTDSGPFGFINGSYKINQNYEQWQFIKADLAKVDRKKTPWVFAMSHRPMYSSGVSSYQANMRNAFEDLFLEYGVDAYISGHIHWYERMYPLKKNGTIDTAAIVDKNTYKVTNGSITHIVNGQAGNVESHSTLSGSVLNITAKLDTKLYGFSKLTVVSATEAKIEFVTGDGKIGDTVALLKDSKSSGGGGHKWWPREGL